MLPRAAPDPASVTVPVTRAPGCSEASMFGVSAPSVTVTGSANAREKRPLNHSGAKSCGPPQAAWSVEKRTS